MRHLKTGVHPGICPAGTHQINRVISHSRDRPAKLRLDRSDTGFLELPTMKITPVVFEYKGYTAIADRLVRG